MNKINWSNIETAQGFADHIPDAILKLTSSNEIDRKNAYWEIDNYVVLQSDLYEAAFYVIDPIVEILEKDYTVDRVLPIRVLVEIALGGNGIKEFNFGDGKLKSISKACEEKLKSIKNKISKIETRSEKEKDELSTLMSLI